MHQPGLAKVRCRRGPRTGAAGQLRAFSNGRSKAARSRGLRWIRELCCRWSTADTEEASWISLLRFMGWTVIEKSTGVWVCKTGHCRARQPMGSVASGLTLPKSDRSGVFGGTWRTKKGG
jgi:hypothetical protein